MKIKKHKSLFFDPKTSILKPFPRPITSNTPKPHKLICYALFVFCFWNFIYQIISIIHIYLDDYATNRSYLTWSISSICTALFCTFAVFFLYDNRKILKKLLRQNKLDVKYFDYILMTGYLCLIITYSVNIFFNDKFENPQGNYGIMLSFSNLLIISSFVFLLTKDFKIKLVFLLILSIFWTTIIFSNDIKHLFYEIQVVKTVVKIISNLSLLIIFMFYSQKKPKENRKKPKASLCNSVISNSAGRVKESFIHNDQENKLYSFLNQIHSAIIIFDEEMELKFYNKEIFSFISHPNSKNHEASLACLDRIPMPMTMSKSDYTKAEILQKLNEITNIQLFASEEIPIKEVLQIEF